MYCQQNLVLNVLVEDEIVGPCRTVKYQNKTDIILVCLCNVSNVVWFETVALTKRQKAELEVSELMMLRFSLRVTRNDKNRKENISGTSRVGYF